LKGSKPLAEPILAELATDERGFHSDASLDILEYKPAAMLPNHNAKTAAEAVHVVPASQLSSHDSRPKLFPGPAREAVDSMVSFAICGPLRDALAVARPRPEGCQAELQLEGPGPGE
jgi:hypothetical protein